MIRSLLICSALVASSGAGAVALSALHDATGDRHVRTLAPAPVAQVEPRFVIPSFAPSRTETVEPVQVALLEAPETPVAKPLVTAPAVADPAAQVLTEDLAAPQAAPAVKPKQRPAVVAKPKRSVKKKPVQTARTLKPQTNSRAKARVMRPVIVAQAPSFRADNGSAIQPDYVIGVYR